jgi:YidC/Oxa1 family membrane protein insertase
MKKILTLIVVVFVGLCAWLILQSSLSIPEGAQGPYLLLQQTTPDAASQTGSAVPNTIIQDPTPPADARHYGASGGAAQTVTLGDMYEVSGYKFALELTTRGAAIRSATFSEHKDRDPDDPQPLVFLAPVSIGSNEILSLANQGFILSDQRQKLRLNRLDWKLLEKNTAGSQHSAQFEALITDDTNTPVIRLTKTYHVAPDSYLLDCDITVENLGSAPQNVYMDLSGPTGLQREGFRQDLRKPVAAFRNAQGKIKSNRLEIKELKKAESAEARELTAPNADMTPLWVATVNKYFAAIVVPLADDGLEPGNWLLRKTGVLYNPDGDIKANNGDETIGLDLRTRPLALAAKGQAGSKGQYRSQIYLGPKDKSLFDKNPRFDQLGFLETIDFMGCCCPKGVIYPLAFAILGLMKLMYTVMGPLGNYGIVIIILVFLVRLIMHPVTKKSQVSMHKMSSLAPKAEEIKKKYANNKAEMNKQMMALYKEQGASPVMGFLPMFIQMPVWIALWSAVNASVDLRGAGFLPIWITDLSMPDALIRFSAFTVPIAGWTINSFNLLPILMGVAFYLQQKLMPTQAAAASNPQMAQQQKMMQIMMPILFPLMLYNVASGVNLYIMTSTFVGVLEQHLIRKHIREKEALESQGMVAVTSKTGGKVKKKKPKPMFKQ